jgi:hypothetical protein
MNIFNMDQVQDMPNTMKVYKEKTTGTKCKTTRFLTISTTI